MESLSWLVEHTQFIIHSFSFRFLLLEAAGGASNIPIRTITALGLANNLELEWISPYTHVGGGIQIMIFTIQE